ncbi:hypothetical protein D3C78_1262590 [compost metagenome]
MEFAVGAGAVDDTGVEYLVAGLEQRDLVADGLHHAGSIEAEHARFAVFRRLVAAHLGVDGVYRNGLHFHQNVVPFRFRLGQVDIDEGVFRRDGLAGPVTDGAHEQSPLLVCVPLT